MTCAGHPPSETPQPFISPTLHILDERVRWGVGGLLGGGRWGGPGAGVGLGMWAAGSWLPYLADMRTWQSRGRGTRRPGRAAPATTAPNPPQVHSVEDALEQLTAAETISGYRPTESAAPVEASKALRLQRLPPLLVLYLMRFDPANRHQKIGWVGGGGGGGGGAGCCVACAARGVWGVGGGARAGRLPGGGIRSLCCL